MKTRTKITFFLSLSACISGCLTRAPTTYELDRRAGLSPSATDPTKAAEMTSSDIQAFRATSTIAMRPKIPVKMPALIEKVWVNDLTLADGAKLQGTWLFLEVEPGKWFDEVDSGAAPILQLKN